MMMCENGRGFGIDEADDAVRESSATTVSISKSVWLLAASHVGRYPPEEGVSTNAFDRMWESIRWRIQAVV